MIRTYFCLSLFIICFYGCADDADDYTDSIKQHREYMDEFFVKAKSSPLSEKDKADFKGLEYFDIDKNFAVDARIEKFDSLQYIDFKHTRNRTFPFIRWGIAHFKLQKDSCHLTLYLSADSSNNSNMLFIPFKDATNGVETYGGGRYLDLEIPTDNYAILDFNLCYNPSCAYSEQWSCPIVPRENILLMRIEAGVKDFKH